jgi:GGDEF domain-containing protein
MIAEIDGAFSSAETVYPGLLDPSGDETALARDYFAFKACWERVQQTTFTDDETLKKEGELCWLRGNKVIFDLHYVMEQRSKSMLNNLFILGLFGSLLILYLLYQIYRYVHDDLETHQMIDLQTGLYNANAFLEECAIDAVSSQRNRAPLSVVLMKFSRNNKTQKQIGAIAGQLKQSCRREEKLFHLSNASFALLTPNTKSSELGPLIERIHKNLSQAQGHFTIETFELSPETDAEAFGPAALSRLEAMKD